MTSVDPDLFESVARRAIRTGLADQLPRHKPDRDAFLEAEGGSLAYALAEVAEQRLDDLRAEAKAA